MELVLVIMIGLAVDRCTKWVLPNRKRKIKNRRNELGGSDELMMIDL